MIRPSLLAASAAALVACAPVAPVVLPVATLDPAPVVAAERAFAARAGVIGPRDAFIENFAPDAVSFAPLPGPAQQRLAAGGQWGIDLQWWPVDAGISRAGDLGWTTGPAEIRRTRDAAPHRTAFYSSVWRREADGSWKVLVDLGVMVPAEAVQLPRDAAVPAAERTALPALADPLAALRAVDAAVGARGTVPLAGLHAAARWHTADRAPVQGARAVAEALAARPPLRWRADAVGIATSGDLGYSYGQGAWRRDDGEQPFVYLAVWERGVGGWTLRLLVQEPLPPNAQ